MSDIDQTPTADQWQALDEFTAPPRFEFKRGSIILDEADRPPSWWGAGDDILAAAGEALMIAGPQGLGKSTLGQQLALGRCGFPEYAELLGYPVTPGKRRVLYLAMDRPRQIARSMRRMVGSAWRAELDERLAVWTGPPPFDLAANTNVLTRMAHDAGADTVVVDSLKDAALALNEDGAGAGYNRARQAALEAGVELIELHHCRKRQAGANKEKPTIADVYGSVWLTSGAGSVLLLDGDPGSPLVKLHHVKQPLAEVGPLTVMHEATTGRSTVAEVVDLVALARVAGPLSALSAAKVLTDTDKPTANEKEKARRRLENLTRSGLLAVVDEGDKALNKPRLWGAA